MKLGRLRRLIREFGLDADMRNMAGSFMDFGADGAHRDRESSLMNPPPGLGGTEEDDENTDGTQEKSQPGARNADRRGGASGSPRAIRRDG